MTPYAWKLAQVPTILAHLRDSMNPLKSTRFDMTRVDGTRDQELPFRLEPMNDADDLWGALLAYGRVIARSIHPAPEVLTGSVSRTIRASTDWFEAGDQAYTVTAWLIHHEQRLAELDLDVDGLDLDLFTTIGRLLAKYRITPPRLRTRPVRCVLCGEVAVRAEWAMNRDGDLAQSVQCTVCLTRYEPEEVRHAPADISASGEEDTPVGADHQAVA